MSAIHWDSKEATPPRWDQTTPVLRWDQADSKEARTVLTMDTAKTGFRQLTEDQLAAKIADHIMKMSGNTHFPTPNPSVAEFATSTTPFTDAVAGIAALDSQRQQLCNVRDAARPVAEAAMLKRASYVQATSGGAGALIISSGFELAKPHGGAHGTLSIPPTPSALAVTMSVHVGTLHTIWHAQQGYTWVVQVCADPLTEANFSQVAITSHSTVDISGLTSGTKYWVRVAAVKGGIQGDWCQPLMCMAP